MKPNLQLAEFLKELLAEYDENKKDEVLDTLSKKWQIEKEEIEFYVEAIHSYYYRPILLTMGASASYDENFIEVFRAMDYLNGKIDAEGNLKTIPKIRKFIFSLFRKNLRLLKWLFIIVFTLIFVFVIRLIINFLSNLFS